MFRWCGIFTIVMADVRHCCGGQEMFRKCNNGVCPLGACEDCAWGEWSEWGPASCEGLCERFRIVATGGNACGAPCQGAKIETKHCKPECYKHPRNCMFGDWQNWSVCDSECGGGQQYRERKITQQAEDHGLPCEGVTKETRNCGDKACFVLTDCQMGAWTGWSACSATCNTGQQQRSRLIIQHASHGGTPCDSNVSEIRGCSETPCHEEKDCKWGEWGVWSACSQSCGGGDRSRSRLIASAPRTGGKLCEPLDMSVVEHCNTHACEETVDCVFGAWTTWDACSCSCNGIQHRVRHIRIYPEEGGRPCSGPLREVKNCNTGDACNEPGDHEPVDCELEEWGAWDACSSSCGTGERVRHRSFVRHHHNGGKPCEGTVTLVEPCPGLPACTKKAEADLELDCKWSEWDDWGACSASCNGGEKVRQRQVESMPNPAGKPCKNQASMEVAPCGMDPCGCADCKWSPWSEWGACTCTGLRERHRSNVSPQHSCGHMCKGAKVVTESCHPHCLSHARHCEFNPWSAWSTCSAACEGGESQRERSVKQVAVHGGHACEGDLKEIRPCNTQSCGGPTDCHVTEWSEWTACTATCNGGQSFRERRIKGEEERGGQTCKAVLKEVRTCGTTMCGESVDCVWGEWSEYSACSTHCGGGTKVRDRFVKVAPRLHGKLCDPIPKSEVVTCNTQPCGEECVDASWSEWSMWSICSVSCGFGWHHRDRTTAQSANHCGRGLSGLKQEFKPCDFPCHHHAQDCTFSEWSPYGDCSCTCNGIRDRNRHIASFAANGGKNCQGPLKEVQSCNVGLCDVREPIDCELSDWEPWEDCSHRCGGGSQTRTRRILTPPKHEGRACDPPLKEIRGCNMHPCTHDVDCEWDSWDDWGTCTKECGAGGEQMRYRRINVLPQHEGKPCEQGDSMQVQSCNNRACGGEYFCGFSEWAEWSECSVTCGEGEQIRRRDLKLSTKRMDDVLASGRLNQIFSVTFEDLTNVQIGGVFTAGIMFSTLSFFMLTRVLRGTSQAAAEAEQLLLYDPNAAEDNS